MIIKPHNYSISQSIHRDYDHGAGQIVTIAIEFDDTDSIGTWVIPRSHTVEGRKRFTEHEGCEHLPREAKVIDTHLGIFDEALLHCAPLNLTRKMSGRHKLLL